MNIFICTKIIFFDILSLQRGFLKLCFFNTKFCHKTLDGTVCSSNSIWHNDIIIHVAQLIGFFSHQQPMSLLLNIQILSACSSCRALQKPSTFPSSTCLDLLRANFMYAIVVNFFLVEAETRRRWDIFQAEVTLYWELAVRRCSHPSLNLKWLYKVIYRHFWRRDSWRWRQFSNKASQHNQMHRN